LSQKTLFLGQKVRKRFGKSLEKVRKKFGNFGNRVFRMFGNFRKLRKNDVKLKLRKLRKTRSDSKTDSKVRIKVWNAGPYLTSARCRAHSIVGEIEVEHQSIFECNRALQHSMGNFYREFPQKRCIKSFNWKWGWLACIYNWKG